MKFGQFSLKFGYLCLEFGQFSLKREERVRVTPFWANEEQAHARTESYQPMSKERVRVSQRWAWCFSVLSPKTH